MTRNRPKVRPVRSIVRIGALIILLIGVSGSFLFAQPAPTVVSSLRTTSTAPTSIRVGCTLAGTCTGGIVAGPLDVASITSGGFIEIASNVPVSQTNRLVNNAGTLSFNGNVLATGASLSGTLNTIPVFTASNAVGNSIMTQNVGATIITVTGALNATVTLGGTLSTATQNSVTTMTGLTSVGTIATGTWNATIIGLAKGGTGVSLAGTGGTGQFLKQNTLGGTITVTRPAIADLSDASNVAILNAANTFTVTNTATTALGVRFNAGNAPGGFGIGNSNGFVYLGSNTRSQVGSDTPVYDITAAATQMQIHGGIFKFFTAPSGTAGNPITFTERWGINNAGDFTFGTASHIADSSGTPTTSCTNCTAGSSITGTDYAFTLFYGTSGTPATTIQTVTFGHTWSSPPVCTASTASTTTIQLFPLATTTAVSVTTQGPMSPTVAYVQVLCRGY